MKRSRRVLQNMSIITGFGVFVLSQSPVYGLGAFISSLLIFAISHGATVAFIQKRSIKG